MTPPTAITTATVRGAGRIDDATAGRIAELWRTAYDGMRAALTDVINGNRAFLAECADQLTEERQRAAHRTIRQAEETRRELGQLDRGTHRACTRSPGMFSPSAALSVVERALASTRIGDPNKGNVYRLAAELSDVTADHS